MIVADETQEIKTVLVSSRMHTASVFLLLLFSFMWIISLMVYGGKHSLNSSHKIDSHLIFSLPLFSKNRFIIENYEMLRRSALGTFLISFLALFFSYRKMGNSYDLGFFKIDLSRVNVNGDIFQWQEVTSLRFTINSPKIFGERSAKHGFSNWIEFTSKSQAYRYEFYLKTQAMEDILLELISQIKTKDGGAVLNLKAQG